MKTINAITDIVVKITNILSIILFIWMVFALTLQVFGRYFFGMGFPWSEESARFCMIWLVYIGSAQLMFRGEHVKVTLIEDMLKGSAKKILIIFQYLLMALFTLAITYYSFGAMAITKLSVAQNIPLTMDVIYAIFPVTGIAMFIGAILRIIALFMKQDTPDAEGVSGA